MNKNLNKIKLNLGENIKKIVIFFFYKIFKFYLIFILLKPKGEIL